MTEHKVGTREEWLAARKKLLEQEQEHAVREFRVRRRDEYEENGGGAAS